MRRENRAEFLIRSVKITKLVRAYIEHLYQPTEEDFSRAYLFGYWFGKGINFFENLSRHILNCSGFQNLTGEHFDFGD